MATNENAVTDAYRDLTEEEILAVWGAGMTRAEAEELANDLESEGYEQVMGHLGGFGWVEINPGATSGTYTAYKREAGGIWPFTHGKEYCLYRGS